MPTYQYACTACDHRFEIFQAFSDSSLTTCPECQGRLRKLFGSVGIVFKGSGFYRTDSRANGSGNGESSSSSESSTSGSGKSESGKSESGSAKESGSSSSSSSGSSDSSSAGSSSSSSTATQKAS